MKKISLLIAIFNLLDGVFTYMGLKNNIIDESNPIMKRIWEISPFLFLLVKLLLSILILLIAHRLPKKNKVKWLFFLLLIFFTFLMFYHLFWFVLYLRIKSQ